MAAKSTSYYVKSAMGIAIMLFFGHIPPVGYITPMGMTVLGIYIGLLLLWTVVDMVWPSLLGLFLLGLSGYSTIPALISAGWGNTTNVYIAAIFMLAYFVIKSGVSDIMVNSILSRKFAKGKPWMISFLFFVAAYVVGAIVSLTPSALIVWAVFTQYCKELGYKKSEPYPVIMIIGICLASLMGFSLFPFNPPASILVGMAADIGVYVPFVSFVIVAFLIGWGSLGLYLLVAKYIFRPDVSLLQKEYEFKVAQKMTPYQVKILFFTILWVALLTMQSALSHTLVGGFLAQFQPVGVTLAVLMIMAFLRTKEGQPMADLIDAARNGVYWSVFFLLTIGMPIGFALADAELGFGGTLQMALDPFFYREGGLMLFGILVTFFTILGTSFMLNHISAMMLYAVVILYAGRLNVNLALLISLIGVVSNTSFLFPSSNPVAAVMHGMKDWVTTADISKYAFPLAVIVWVVSTIVFLIGNTFIF